MVDAKGVLKGPHKVSLDGSDKVLTAKDIILAPGKDTIVLGYLTIRHCIVDSACPRVYMTHALEREEANSAYKGDL